jgi:signal transduction histidine kinase
MDDGSVVVAPRRAGLTRWRDWKVTTKLVAVIGVPLLFLFALGGVQVRAAVAKTSDYARVEKLVAVTAAVRDTVAELQQERTTAAAKNAAGKPHDPALPPRYKATDSAAKTFGQRLVEAGTLPAGAAGLRPATTAALGQLPALRKSAPGAGQVAIAYSKIIGTLLLFDQELASGLADPQLAYAALALFDLQSVQEEVAYQRAVLVGDTVTPAQRELVRASDARMSVRAADFLATASPAGAAAYKTAMASAGAQARDQLKNTLLSGEGQAAMPPMLGAAAEQTGTALGAAAAGLTTKLQTQVAQLRENASNAAGLASVILFVALLIAAGVMIAIARQLVRSLGALRRRADDVASRRLPAAVADLRAGRRVDTQFASNAGPDEIGQLGAAFDAVHAQALRLAMEQTRLRGNYAEIFVNLSRRSETLVQRQLALIEQLEQDEDDPDQLSTLFQLDHLATRMRRNNENLMVLSGTDVTRQFNRPVGLTDVLRAAVSEIEHYQRVVVGQPAAIAVAGYAVGDVVRLVAELLDNATAFSAPTTQVSVTCYPARAGGVSLEILDQGVGMPEDQVAAANAQLSASGEMEPSTSRRMGLFVVGRLARRHGVRVWLHSASNNVGEELGGVRATVTLPAALLAPESDSEGGSADAWRPSPRQKVLNGGHPADLLASLPKRRPRRLARAPRTVPPPVGPDIPEMPAANGVPVSPALAAAAAAVEEVAGLAPERHTHTAEHTGEILIAPPPAEPAAEPAEPVGDSTPIFNEMSGWFAEKDDSKAPAQKTGEGWQSAADADFAAVSRALTNTPTKLTSAGLPKRTPKAMLVPGAATTSAPAPGAAKPGVAKPGVAKPAAAKPAAAKPAVVQPVPAAAALPARVLPASVLPASVVPAVAPAARQSAENVRDRFASYQRGVREGRSAEPANGDGQENG